jgi:predicted  nucleic acid-binding Zn-ribbon protein
VEYLLAALQSWALERQLLQCKLVSILIQFWARKGNKLAKLLCSEMNNEVQSLHVAHEKQTQQILRLESDIAEIGARIPELKSQKSKYTDLVASVVTLEGRCSKMRVCANKLSAQLLKDRQFLTNARMKTEYIASNLRNAEYSKTRREIGTHLVDILRSLEQISAKGTKGINNGNLSQALKLVRKIERSTPKLLPLLESVS